jgi:hypothetical protein
MFISILVGQMAMVSWNPWSKLHEYEILMDITGNGTTPPRSSNLQRLTPMPNTPLSKRAARKVVKSKQGAKPTLLNLPRTKHQADTQAMSQPGVLRQGNHWSH